MLVSWNSIVGIMNALKKYTDSKPPQLSPSGCRKCALVNLRGEDTSFAHFLYILWSWASSQCEEKMTELLKG